MNIKEIEELIKFVAKSGVSEVELELKDFKICIKTQHKEKSGQQQSPQQHFYHAPAPPQQQAPPQAAAPAPAAETKSAEAPKSPAGNIITIKSPMIGTFYRTPNPDKPSFVNVGDEIKPGKVLCIIEAMKLFNEIESEVTGRIVKVLVDNASPVEYDQPLFEIEPL
ncbi:MAG: acetyl-CoA carboxylase biotin carboxyl carrier protein [Bacteroidia bacterium]